METKKPTLEEIKDYFKNAKEVKCLANLEIFEINFKTINEKNNNDTDNYWCFSKNGSWILLWSFLRQNYAEIISYKEEITQTAKLQSVTDLQPPKHYDNSKGSIYQFCENQNLNSYEFDIIKRVARSRKKGNFKEDLEKTKHLIDLYLKEYEVNK